MPRGVSSSRTHTRSNRDLPIIDDQGQCYARAEKMLGAGRLMVLCTDGISRIGKIRGKMRRSEWIALGDIVMVSTRDFQDDKVDILCRLTPLETQKIKRLGYLEELNSVTKAKKQMDGEEEEDLIAFEVGDDEDLDFVNDI